MPEAFERPVERPGDLPHPVVDLRRRSVQAHRDAGHPTVVNARRLLRIDHRPVRRQGGDESTLPRVTDQVKQVLPAERLAAREYQHRHERLAPAQLGQLFDESLGLGGGKIPDVRLVRLQPAAMDAGQIAPNRRLPEEHAQDPIGGSRGLHS